MATVHISMVEAMRDFAALLVRVRAGAEVVIEDGTEPVAVMHSPLAPRRFISECIALAKKHEEEMGTAPILDEDFADDVERIVSQRGSWDPPAWD